MQGYYEHVNDRKKALFRGIIRYVPQWSVRFVSFSPYFAHSYPRESGNPKENSIIGANYDNDCTFCPWIITIITEL